MIENGRITGHAEMAKKKAAYEGTLARGLADGEFEAKTAIHSPVPDALNQLHMVISQMQDSLDQLAGRLTPIMARTEQGDSKPAASIPTPNGSSTLHELICEAIIRVSNTTNTISYIRSQIEL